MDKPAALFRVKHTNDHWMVCIPLNDAAKRVIQFKKASLWPKWSPDMDNNPDEERREIIRKANALTPAYNFDPLV
jgi:hypothetical protein